MSYFSNSKQIKSSQSNPIIHPKASTMSIKSQPKVICTETIPKLIKNKSHHPKVNQVILSHFKVTPSHSKVFHKSSKSHNVKFFCHFFQLKPFDCLCQIFQKIILNPRAANLKLFEKKINLTFSISHGQL